MNQQKQVDEIRSIILENIDYGVYETAKAIYKENYRKVPPCGVVLTFDHYDNLLKFDSEVLKETANKYHAEMEKIIESVPNATKEFIEAWKLKNDEIFNKLIGGNNENI